MFVIEDVTHCESCAQHATREEALADLRRRAATPWNEPPNVAPCGSWKTCGRCYVLIEFDAATTPWTELGRAAALDVSAAGVVHHLPTLV